MKKIVGWKEWLSLPDLGIDKLECKVDTGAKNSALHAFEVEEFQVDGEKWVRFSLHLSDKDPTQVQTCEAKVVDCRNVTDSSGNTSERYFIETAIQLGMKKVRVQVSLTSRDTMAFKMLLGRTALRRAGFLVDPSQSYLQGKKK